LAGAVDKGEDGKGLTLIAGKDPVRYEAQSNAIQIQAKQLINIQSANAHIDWAAAKKISLSTADGANITIEGGNITIQCPGQLTVHAASKTFDGPTRLSYPLPGLPAAPMKLPKIKFDLALHDVPGEFAAGLPLTDWRVVRAADEDSALMQKKELLHGKSDDKGAVKLTTAEEKTLHEAYNLSPSKLWLVYESRARQLVLETQRESWTDDQKLYQALDAMGYSDDYGIVGENTVDEFHATVARKETKKRTGAAMLKKLEGGA
jgi:type VI secretion system secreted protein VgrG